MNVRVWFTTVSVVAMIFLLGARAFGQDPPQRPDGASDVWLHADPLIRATNRGIALMERYEYASAVTAFEEANRLAPGSVEVRVNLAIAIYNRNKKDDLERAEQLLGEVLRDHPDHPRALYVRAIMYQYRGHDEQALPLMSRVVTLVPDDEIGRASCRDSV